MSPPLDAALSAVDQAWPYVLTLGTIILFAVGCRVAWRLGQQHKEADPRAPVKAGIAMAASLALGLAGTVILVGPAVTVPILGHVVPFQDAARQGMHDTLVKSLNLTIGEGDYLEGVHTASLRPATITMLEGKLAGFNATLAAIEAGGPGDALAARGNVTETWSALNQSRADLHAAQVKVRTLAPNHRLWLLVHPLLVAHGDAEAEALVVKATKEATVTDVIPLGGETGPCARDAEGYCKSPASAVAIQHSFFDAHEVRNIPFEEGGPAAFEHQRQFNQQMGVTLRWFVFPGITGLFLAPFAFFGGHVLGRAFEASESVGFKRYPGKAAGLFLLMMGGTGVLVLAVETIQGWSPTPPSLDLFGLFTIPYGAWVLRDLHKRSAEGQIAL